MNMLRFLVLSLSFVTPILAAPGKPTTLELSVALPFIVPAVVFIAIIRHA
jgi:hypothetical protein